MQYVKELDGVRTIAVLFVLIAHWAGLSPIAVSFYGFIGVTLFFVLSGFLISRNLLTAFAKGFKTKIILQNFFFRRTIRIFPIYFLSIAVGLLFGFAPFRQHLIWLITYQVNHLMCFGNVTGFVHYWTLSVEEQFYIFFPFVIAFSRSKKIISVSFFFIAIAILSRYALYYSGINKVSHNVLQCLTVCCFDSFFIGTILAWQHINPSKKMESKSVAFLCLLASMICLVGLFYFYQLDNIALGKTPMGRTFFSITAALVLRIILFHPNTFLHKILNSSVISYIGKISYGIYLYHLFMPNILQYLFGYNNAAHAIGFNFMVYFIATILLASVSFYIFEQPINGLKNKFFLLK